MMTATDYRNTYGDILLDKTGLNYLSKSLNVT